MRLEDIRYRVTLGECEHAGGTVPHNPWRARVMIQCTGEAVEGEMGFSGRGTGATPCEAYQAAIGDGFATLGVLLSSLGLDAQS